MATNASVTIMSYNCCGFNKLKCDYIKSLFASCNILLLQEHWLSDDQLTMLGSIDSMFSHIAVSGFGNSDVLDGRPYGGCAILWRSDMSIKVNTVDTNSKRVCAARMMNDNLKLLVICVYMPYEGNNEMTDEFIEQLAVVDDVIAANQDCHIVVGGDFNVDFARDRLHTTLLDSFCEHVGLHAATRQTLCDIDYSYNFNMSRFNTLDHFLLSGAIFSNSVNRISVYHDSDNVSDHDPIVLQLALDCQRLDIVCIKHYPALSWGKATNDNLITYRSVLRSLIRDIELPTEALLCKDFNCCNAGHYQAINSFADSITRVCIHAGELSIPHTSGRQESDRMPGWSEHVQPLRDKSMFWHHLWIEGGRPRTGIVADIMRRTRAAYHYAIRKIKRDEDIIIRERFAAAVTDNDQRNFWSEVKRMRSCGTVISKTVDGQSSISYIADLFANKYRDLYTSIPHDESDMC